MLKVQLSKPLLKKWIVWYIIGPDIPGARIRVVLQGLCGALILFGMGTSFLTLLGTARHDLTRDTWFSLARVVAQRDGQAVAGRFRPREMTRSAGKTMANGRACEGKFVSL